MHASAPVFAQERDLCGRERTETTAPFSDQSFPFAAIGSSLMLRIPATQEEEEKNGRTEKKSHKQSTCSVQVTDPIHYFVYIRDCLLRRVAVATANRNYPID